MIKSNLVEKYKEGLELIKRPYMNNQYYSYYSILNMLDIKGESLERNIIDRVLLDIKNALDRDNQISTISHIYYTQYMGPIKLFENNIYNAMTYLTTGEDLDIVNGYDIYISPFVLFLILPYIPTEDRNSIVEFKYLILNSYNILKESMDNSIANFRNNISIYERNEAYTRMLNTRQLVFNHITSIINNNDNGILIKTERNIMKYVLDCTELQYKTRFGIPEENFIYLYLDTPLLLKFESVFSYILSNIRNRFSYRAIKKEVDNMIASEVWDCVIESLNRYNIYH